MKWSRLVKHKTDIISLNKITTSSPLNPHFLNINGVSLINYEIEQLICKKKEKCESFFLYTVFRIFEIWTFSPFGGMIDTEPSSERVPRGP